jgi:hypothetical protein
MVNIFVIETTPRLEYAFRLVFETILERKVAFFTNPKEFNAAHGVKINYSDNKNEEGLYLKPAPLLFDSTINPINPQITRWGDLPAFFPTEKSFLPFDLFAASFYLVTRYEEYTEGDRDRHGRYKAENSLAVKYDFYMQPLVNKWAIKLANLLKKQSTDFEYKKSTFNYIPTFDIDNAWAFKHKPVSRIFLSSCKDLLYGRFHNLRKRFKVILNTDTDPFDNYDFMLETVEKFSFKPVFFFLLNNKGHFDRALPAGNKHYRKLIANIAKKHKIGIHPSYASNNNTKQLRKETDLLDTIINNKVIYSRQHFLKLQLPYTYQNLISLGIETDYTMGYHNFPGFRASLATPFMFFDLQQNKTTKLKILPFQVMDVALNRYIKLNGGNQLNIIELLMEETALVGGTFVSLWHNESLGYRNENDKRRYIYSQMTSMARKIQNEDDGRN